MTTLYLPYYINKEVEELYDKELKEYRQKNIFGFVSRKTKQKLRIKYGELLKDKLRVHLQDKYRKINWVSFPDSYERVEADSEFIEMELLTTYRHVNSKFEHMRLPKSIIDKM